MSHAFPFDVNENSETQNRPLRFRENDARFYVCIREKKAHQHLCFRENCGIIMLTNVVGWCKYGA